MKTFDEYISEAFLSRKKQPTNKEIKHPEVYEKAMKLMQEKGIDMRDHNLLIGHKAADIYHKYVTKKNKTHKDLYPVEKKRLKQHAELLAQYGIEYDPEKAK